LRECGCGHVGMGVGGGGVLKFTKNIFFIQNFKKFKNYKKSISFFKISKFVRGWERNFETIFVRD
jgi:hypothetical protein